MFGKKEKALEVVKPTKEEKKKLKLELKEKKKEEKLLKQEEKMKKVQENLKRYDEKLKGKGYTQDDIDDMPQVDTNKSLLKQFGEYAEQESRKFKLDYLGGHPDINPGKKLLEPTKKENNIKVAGRRLEVTKISWDEKGKRSAGKAAAGALIGGALTAGAGAIVGAAIGGRKKDDSLAVITIQEGVFEHILYFRCDKKEYQKLVGLLK